MSTHGPYKKVTRRGIVCDICSQKNTSVMQECLTCHVTTCINCHRNNNYDFRHVLANRDDLDWTNLPAPQPASRQTRGRGRARAQTPARRSTPGRATQQTSSSTPGQATDAALTNPGRMATRSSTRQMPFRDDPEEDEELPDYSEANLPRQLTAGRSGPHGEYGATPRSNSSFVPPGYRNADPGASMPSPAVYSDPYSRVRATSSASALATGYTTAGSGYDPIQAPTPETNRPSKRLRTLTGSTPDVLGVNTPGATIPPEATIAPGATIAPEAAVAPAAMLPPTSSLNLTSVEHFNLFRVLFVTWETNPVLAHVRQERNNGAAIDMMQAAITLEIMRSSGSWVDAAKEWMEALRRVEGHRRI